MFQIVLPSHIISFSIIKVTLAWEPQNCQLIKTVAHFPSAAHITPIKLCSWANATLEYQSHLVIGRTMLSLSNMPSDVPNKDQKTSVFLRFLGIEIYITFNLLESSLKWIFGTSIWDFKLLCLYWKHSSSRCPREDIEIMLLVIRVFWLTAKQCQEEKQQQKLLSSFWALHTSPEWWALQRTLFPW